MQNQVLYHKTYFVYIVPDEQSGKIKPKVTLKDRSMSIHNKDKPKKVSTEELQIGPITGRESSPKLPGDKEHLSGLKY